MFTHIEADLGPWLAKTQLITWNADGEGLDLAGLEPDRALTLSQGQDDHSWVQPLLDLRSTKTAPVTEAEVLEVAKTAKAEGPGAPVLMLASREDLVGSGTVGLPPAVTVVGDPPRTARRDRR